MNGRRTEIGGIPLGEPGSPKSPVLLGLKKMGIAMNPTTVARLRSQDTSGLKTVMRIDCSRVLADNDASKKDQLYLDIANAGLALRETYVGQFFSHRFSSFGFTERIAREVDIRPQIVRQLLRDMRADLISAEEEGLDTTEFTQTAQTYLNHFTTPRGYEYPTPLNVYNHWDNKSVAGFYRLLYFYGDRSALSTWFSYEAEAFAGFYQRQRESGDPLTRFDKEVLEHYVNMPLGNSGHFRREEPAIGSLVRSRTGVKVDSFTLTLHRNVLIYGHPLDRSTK